MKTENSANSVTTFCRDHATLFLMQIICYYQQYFNIVLKKLNIGPESFKNKKFKNFTLVYRKCQALLHAMLITIVPSIIKG